MLSSIVCYSGVNTAYQQIIKLLQYSQVCLYLYFFL